MLPTKQMPAFLIAAARLFSSSSQDRRYELRSAKRSSPEFGAFGIVAVSPGISFIQETLDPVR